MFSNKSLLRVLCIRDYRNTTCAVELNQAFPPFIPYICPHRLGGCYLSEHCWRNFYEVLLCNQSLIHLDISTNVLKHEDLKLLCEALKQPTCHLKSLW